MSTKFRKVVGTVGGTGVRRWVTDMIHTVLRVLE